MGSGIDVNEDCLRFFTTSRQNEIIDGLKLNTVTEEGQNFDEWN